MANSKNFAQREFYGHFWRQYGSFNHCRSNEKVPPNSLTVSGNLPNSNKDLDRFVSTILLSKESIKQAHVVIDQIIFESKNLKALITCSPCRLG